MLQSLQTLFNHPVLNLITLLCLLLPACVHAKSLQSCLTLQFHGLVLTRLLCLRDSPGKNTGVDCHALLQGIFPTHVWTHVSYISCVGGQGAHVP